MSLSLYRHFSAVIGQAKRGKAHLTDHEREVMGISC